MTTTTTRYGLAKIQPLSDNVDVVVDFNNNWDAIDLKLGAQVATSSTRPSSPIQGQQEFETDTGYVRVYTGAAWKTVGNAVATSGALPANPISGDIVYVSDTKATGFYDGTNWHFGSLIVCTSGTRPSGSALRAGTNIYETDTLRFLVYNGTSWENKAYSNYVCTSSAHPSSPFQGLEIYETDTSLNAVYSGSAYLYPPQQLASNTVSGSSVPSVTLNIPSGFSWLEFRWRARATDAVTAEGIFLQFNGDTGNNYLWEVLQGNNAAAAASSSGAATSKIQIGTIPGASATALYFGSGKSEISGASDTTNYKDVSGYGNSSITTSNMWTGTYGGQWNSAAAVTSITIAAATGNLAIGSSFSVVGFK